MKNLALIFLLIFSLDSFSQKVIVCGSITNPKTRDVQVYFNASDLGDGVVSYDTRLQPDNSFCLEFEIMQPTEATFYDGNEITALYLEPGDSLFITLDTKKFDETVHYQGKGAAHNNYLAACFLRFDDPDNPAFSDPTTLALELSKEKYLFALDSLKNAKLDFFEQHKDKFSEIFAHYARESIIYSYAAHKIYYPAFLQGNSDHDLTIKPDYFDFLEEIPLKSQFVYLTEDYKTFLYQYLSHRFEEAVQVENISQTDYVFALYDLIQKELQGRAVFNIQASLLLSLIEDSYNPAYEKIFNDFLEKCPFPDYKKTVNDSYSVILRTAEGKPAPDFRLKNIKGKQVALSDFRGKVVYLTVWASWYKPCICEIPDGKVLAKKYHKNRDVIFLNVSLDDKPGEWKEAVEKYELQGIHLISNIEGLDISSLYNIKDLPAFFLIDQQGKIVRNPAPSPSSGNASQEIEALLN